MFKKRLFLISFLVLMLTVVGCEQVGEDKYSLEIDVEPQEGGIIQTDGDEFPPDTVVTLIPEPTEGWELMEWGGPHGDEVIETADAWQILMDGDKEITAYFADTKFVAKPQFYPDSGEYRGAQEIEITTDTPEAIIHYTLDGTTPTEEHGEEYTEPVNIAENTNIKAMAFKEDMVESDVVEAEYTILYGIEKIITPQGSGEITLTPEEEEYVSGTTVEVEAIPDDDYLFSHWNEDLTGEENPVEIIIDKEKTIEAVFVGTNARAENIEISEGELIPEFAPSETEYEVDLEFDVEEVELTVEAQCPNATIEISGEELDPEEDSVSVSLDVGENEVEIKITSEDGSNEKIYTVNFFRQFSVDLMSLELSGGVLDPTLREHIDEYTVRAPYEEDTLVMYPISEDPEATVEVNGEVVLPGEPSQEFDLTAGEKTDPIIIEVISRDGEASRKYEIRAFRSLWEYVGEPGLSEDSAVGVSLFVTEGTPYVIYNDSEYGYRGVVRKFENNEWKMLGDPGHIGVSSSSSIFVHEEIPYVAYQDEDANNKTSVQKYENGQWSFIGEQGFTKDLDWGQNIIVDDDGTIYVSYSDGPYGFGEENGEITVRKFDGQEWVILGERRFTPDVVFSHDLTIVDGTPHIIFRDVTQGNRATVKKFDGTEWVAVGDEGFTVGSVDYVDIENYDGQLYIAFRDEDRFNQATVMTYENGEWQYVGDAGFSEDSAGHTSLQIDSNGDMYVSYMDGARNSRATVQKFNGVDWEYVGDPGFSGGRGNGTQLMVDNGEIYVSIWDGGYGFKACVMRYVGR